MIEAQLRALNTSLIESRMVIGPAFATIADLVLKHGRKFYRQALPIGRWARTESLCYANCLQAAKTGRFIYVEGYATEREGGIPKHHAWLTDPAHPIWAYDPTWTDGAEYFGIRFSLEYVLKMYEETGQPGVLDVWELGWPLVSGEHPIGDAIWTPD